MDEEERIRYVIERVGLEEAIKFAEQGLYIYTKDSIKIGKYKEKVAFYLEFLKKHGKDPKFVVVGDLADQELADQRKGQLSHLDKQRTS